MSDPIPVQGQNVAINISTPLTLIGLFVAILRERFLATTPSDPPLKWNWIDDLKTTGVFIEAGFNENMEGRNTRPGIWVDRDQTSYGQVAIGDQDQIPILMRSGQRYYYASAETDMVVTCTSKDRGESMMVGSVVQDFLQMSSRVIQKYFGLRDVSPIILNATTPHEKDRELMVTPVQFRVFYEARWTTLPIAPVLHGINLKLADVTDPDLYFRDIVLRDN